MTAAIVCLVCVGGYLATSRIKVRENKRVKFKTKSPKKSNSNILIKVGRFIYLFIYLF